MSKMQPFICNIFCLKHLTVQPGSIFLITQNADMLTFPACDTDVFAPAECPTLSAGTSCQCEAEPIDRSCHVNLCQASHPPNLVSSISPDSTGAIFFSLCGGVLSWQSSVGSIRQVLHVCLTLGGAAAERRAEACADWSSKKYKHDAVGCSLQGVANSLWGQNKGTEEQRGSNKLLHWNKMSFNGLKLQQNPFYII